MKSLKLVSFVLVLLIVSVSCNFFTQTNTKDGVEVGHINKVVKELPTYDPKAPMPSPGAASLRALMVLDPGVAELQGDVEAAERAALNVVIADLSPKTGSSIELPFQIAQSEGAKVAKVANLAPEFSAPASYNISGNFDGLDTAHDVALIAGLTTGLGDIITQHMPAGAEVSGSATETKGDATATMSLEVGRSTDGTTKFGIGMQTETSKNGVPTKTDFASSVDGERCPNAEGQVSFTIKVRLGADSGGAGYTQDLTAFVRAEVGDDARIASTTIDMTQGTRQAKDGRQVYVETGETIKFSGDDVAGLEYSNVRMIRHSQDSTQADASAMSGAGHDAAFAMARTALLISENNWLSGGCVKIEATSPGTVKPGSTTDIPVTVRHRFDGSEVPSKLEAALSGEKSVEPTSLARTPGTLTYTAPDEIGKSATIKLTATSRRGRATLELTANTGGAAYRIVGGLDDWQTDTAVCDIMKPFTLTGGGFTMQVSGGLSGTYTYTGPFNAHGGQSYTISLPEGVGKPGTMTGGGVGSAGGYSNGGTEFYTLTPIDPATGCSQ